MAPNVVLGSSKSSTYPTRETSCLGSLGWVGEKWYDSGFDLPAALLVDRFDKPAGITLAVYTRRHLKSSRTNTVLPQPTNDIQKATGAWNFLNCFSLSLVQ
jgi:hypothetical protein